MSTMKKKIAINPSLFQIGKKNKTTKNKEKKQKPTALISPNVMKKQLLAKIKEHQRQNQNNEENYIEEPWTIIESYFKGQYLNQLIRHQLESYNVFVNYQIMKTIEMFNPVHIKSEQSFNAKLKPTITSDEIINESNDFPQQLMVQTQPVTPAIQNPVPVVQNPFRYSNSRSSCSNSRSSCSNSRSNCSNPRSSCSNSVPVVQEPFPVVENPINTPLLSDPPYGCLKCVQTHLS